MGQTLPHFSKNKFVSGLLVALIIALSAGTISAQTVLSPGDLFFVTINANGGNSFEFVPLVDLEAGTTIKFSNDIWINSESSFKEGGNLLTYIAPDEIQAGTIITFTEKGENGFTATGDFNITAPKGNIFVFQGEKTNPRFIFGAGWSADSDIWSFETVLVSASNIPFSLSEKDGTVLSLASSDNHQYNADNGIEGSKKDLVNLLSSSSNWSRKADSFEGLQSEFTLSEPPSPRLALTTSSETVLVDDGSFDLTVELVESYNTPVEAEVKFLGTLSSASSSDIADFNTETVRFDSDAKSGDSKTISIPLADNIEYEDENERVAVFRLQNISEGAVIEPDTFILTLQNRQTSGISFQIGGNEGWRMITVPERNTKISELFGSFKMQGLQGSANPSGPATIYTWDEKSGEGFNSPSSMSDILEPGKGYLVYFFEDDNASMPGIQGGFPKNITTEYNETNSSVRVNISATDVNGNNIIDSNEGWNLLGNPFNVAISAAELINVLDSGSGNMNSNIYVWNPEKGNGNGGYITLGKGDKIAPFQAFFICFRGDGEINETVTLNKNALVADEEYYDETTDKRSGFSLQLTNGSGFDEYSLEFSDDGTLEAGRKDVLKRYSMNEDAINFYGSVGTEKFQKKILPEDLEASFEIPLKYDYKEEGELTLRWEGIDQLPSDLSVTLIDREENTEINLKTSEQYRFFNSNNSPEKRSGAKATEEKPQLNMMKDNGNDARFLLSISPGSVKNSENELPGSVKLNPNYPNPFNPTTTITYELTEQTDVSLTIWNMIGQKVTTLVDGTREAGEHTETWNASNMPSGMYIAQLEVGGRVYIRKMTLIK